jgi:hypothetical protein
MRSGVKVRTCRSPRTASSSLPSVDDHTSHPPVPPITTPSQQDQGLPGESNFSDGSEALFSMYLRRAGEEDRKMVDGWKGYADGMLVFVSLRPPSHSSRIM